MKIYMEGCLFLLQKSDAKYRSGRQVVNSARYISERFKQYLNAYSAVDNDNAFRRLLRQTVLKEINASEAIPKRTTFVTIATIDTNEHHTNNRHGIGYKNNKEMSKSKKGIVWEDREVLFDLPFIYLKLRSGEKVFDRIEPIEDTKGNKGMKGRLVVTNLRIIWHSLGSPRINLTVGLNCVISISTKVVSSGLRGSTQALYLLAGYNSNKYEFVFTNLAPHCVRHYTSVTGVHRAYAASRMYRDLKLRGAFIHNKQLRILPLEKICLTENGVWNLSSDSGNLGTMVISNVRIVWYADINDSFNVSMPYITIESITVRDSKFGTALVLMTREASGGYVLGFRMESSRLQPLLAELQALHVAYTEAPVFGVEMCWANEVSKPSHEDIDELEEIGEPRGEMGPHLYLASQQNQHKEEIDVQPVYSPYLGLAIEPLKEGFTLQSLFEVQTVS